MRNLEIPKETLEELRKLVGKIDTFQEKHNFSDSQIKDVLIVYLFENDFEKGLDVYFKMYDEKFDDFGAVAW